MNEEKSLTAGNHGSQMQRPISVRVLRGALLIVILVIMVLTAYQMLTGGLPSYIEPVDFSMYPKGPIPDVAPGFAYYGFVSDSRIPVLEDEMSEGRRVMTLHVNSDSSNWFGVSLIWEKPHSVPTGASMNVRWRGGREIFRVLSDITVGGGVGDTANSFGTNYYVYLQSPPEEWTEISVPLKAFKLNPVQPQGPKTIEPFDAARIRQVSFTFWPGTKSTFQIEYVRFVWGGAKWASLAIIGFVLAFGILILERTEEPILLRDGRTDFQSSALMARLAYMLSTLALFLRMESTPTGVFSPQAGIIYALLFVSILADEFFKPFFSGKMVAALKYAAILALGWYIHFSVNVSELIPLIAIAFLPMILYRSRILLFGLPAAALAVLFRFPVLQVSESLLPGVIVIGAVTFVAFFVREIIARHEATREITYTRSLYGEVLENTSDAIFITGIAGKVERVNRGFEVLTGFRSSEVLQRDIAGFLTPNDTVELQTGRTVNAERPAREYDACLVGKDGRNRQVLVREVSLNRDGICQGYQAVATDITARKEAEEVLRQLNSFNELLIRSLPFGISIVDRNGRILFLSDKLREIVGADHVGEACWSIFEDDPKQCEDCPLLEDVPMGKLRKIERRGVSNGKTFQINHAGLLYKGEEAILHVFEDVTETRALQAQLSQAQKMEGLGILASGVAHDFNNILGIILGHASFVAGKMGESNDLSRSLHAIVKSAQRGASLVKEMLTFARKAKVSFGPISVNESVTDVTKLVSETFPKTITVECNLANDLPLIKGDSSQILQALMNLCFNARDAMPGGGVLTISTRLVDNSESMKPRFPYTPYPRYVAIEVKDTGIGMSEETIKHMFEPFFTTKEVGKGTGLGLAVVFGITQNHEGLIDVVSQIDKGTTMRVFLPVGAS